MLQLSYHKMDFYTVVLIGVMLLQVSCNSSTDKTPPTLKILTGNNFVKDSAVLSIGQAYVLGFEVKKGDAPITNLVIALTTENGTGTALDTGMYLNDFQFIRNNTYGATKYEKWNFFLRDKNGESASAYITLQKNKASTYGAIAFYPSVTLGAQNNTTVGSFFSLTDGKIYMQSQATASQSAINLITYWGDKNVPVTEFTLSSPGETDVSTYYPFISTWNAPLNEVRYKADSVSISSQAFDNAQNDSLIIANYTASTAGKRKFKSVKSGFVIPFQLSAGTNAGKRGLIKIKSMQPGINGQITADIKIQK